MGLICSIEKVIYYLVPSVTAMVQQFAKVVKLYNHLLFVVKNFYSVMVLMR